MPANRYTAVTMIAGIQSAFFSSCGSTESSAMPIRIGPAT